MTKECDISDKRNIPFLFHVTSKTFLPDIEKEGLVPQLSGYTKKFIKTRILAEDPPDVPKGIDLDDYVEGMPGLVFAVQAVNLPAAFGMVFEKAIDESSGVVLGIDQKCDAQFEDREVASPVDVVSEKKVSPECLCRMPDSWVNKVVEKYGGGWAKDDTWYGR